MRDYYTGDIVWPKNYYPFGMEMEGRSGGTSDYRYGMNGQEHENEITNSQSHYSAEYWMYDARLGRRWNIDPVVKYHESPYAAFANNPVWFADPNGADSALAAGSKTWQWMTRKRDTYSSISERTGVSEQTLKDLNGYDDNYIPTGQLLWLSEGCETECAGVPAPGGMINFLYYENYALPRNGPTNNLGITIMTTFTPDDPSTSGDYYWFQSLWTNDPKGGDESQNRILGASGKYVDDDGVGQHVFNSWMIYRNPELGLEGAISLFSDRDPEYAPYSSFLPYNQVDPSQTSGGHWDSPQRGPISNGSVSNWRGTLALTKKIDDKYVIISTFQYGFSITKNGIIVDPIQQISSKTKDLNSNKQLQNDLNYLKSMIQRQ